MLTTQTTIRLAVPTAAAIKNATEAKATDPSVLIPIKRTPVTLAIAHYEANDIITLMTSGTEIGEKCRSFITEIVNDAVVAAARDQFYEPMFPVDQQVTAEMISQHFNHDIITIPYLASLPPATRASTRVALEAPSEEESVAFIELYVDVMVNATNAVAALGVERVTNGATSAAKALLGKFAGLRGLKDDHISAVARRFTEFQAIVSAEGSPYLDRAVEVANAIAYCDAHLQRKLQQIEAAAIRTAEAITF